MNSIGLKKYGYGFLVCFVILLGIFLRLKGFLLNPSLWHDECAMAWNIKFKSYAQLFGVLRFLQVTPPFFSVATKFLTGIFGDSEMVFRFIPCLAGCLSVIAFYFLSKKALGSKVSILAAVFLFAINQRLINFSFEFKPYEVDVFFTIATLLFFLNLDVEKLTKLKALIYGTLLSIVPWFSFTSVFAIAGGVFNLMSQSKNKKNLLTVHSSLLTPLIISAILYLKFYLINNYTGTHMVSDWQNYFVTLNPLKFIWLLSESIKYLFAPVKYVLFALIMLGFGAVIYAKEKSVFFSVAILIFISFLIASFAKIYPFGDRIIVFLIPIYLLFIVKPMDKISIDNRRSFFGWLSLMLVLLTFYPQFIWAKSMLGAKTVSRGEHPREMTKLLSQKLKKDDLVFVSSFSDTEFAYYSSFYNFKNEIIKEPHKSNRIEVLNSIPKGKFCWFYIVYDDPTMILDWVNKHTKIINVIHIGQLGNYLIYVYIN